MTTFTEFKKECVQLFGDFGAWAFDEWKRLNETYFNGKNIAGAIVWGSTPKGESMGYYNATENPKKLKLYCCCIVFGFAFLT